LTKTRPQGDRETERHKERKRQRDKETHLLQDVNYIIPRQAELIATACEGAAFQSDPTALAIVVGVTAVQLRGAFGHVCLPELFLCQNGHWPATQLLVVPGKGGVGCQQLAAPALQGCALESHVAVRVQHLLRLPLLAGQLLSLPLPLLLLLAQAPSFCPCPCACACACACSDGQGEVAFGRSLVRKQLPHKRSKHLELLRAVGAL
jgi:hypothetical protein